MNTTVLKWCKNNYVIILFTLIVVLASFLRLYHLGSNIPALSQDEVVNGYDAYALGQTLRDHHGNFLPLTLASFGDSASVALTYLTIPFVALGGLTESMVRLPIALTGIASILIFFVFLKELTGNSRLALLGAFILAISPWHITLTRWAIPPSIVPFFLLLFLWLFTCGIKREKPTLYLIGAGVSAAFMTYAYPSAVVFAPVFVTIVATLYLWSKKRHLATILGVFYILIAPLLTLIIISPETNFRRLGSVQLGSTGWQLISDVSSRFFEYFSPQFLFGPVGMNPMMQVPGSGNFYHFFIYIIIAAAFIFTYRLGQNTKKIAKTLKKLPIKLFLVVMIWALLAPLPASITGDHQHLNRAIALLPLIAILLTFVTYYVLTNFKKVQILLVCAFILISSYRLGEYFHNYTTSYRALAAHTQFYYGVKDGLAYIIKADALKNYRHVVIDRGINQGYIYYLFYSKYDPSTINYEQLNKSLSTTHGYYVESVGKYSFTEIQESDIKDAKLIATMNNFGTTWFNIYEKGDTIYMLKTGSTIFL
jgi:4-amino-4-deoxy-L-arabinose transferase-like glycosyltransferase